MGDVLFFEFGDKTGCSWYSHISEKIWGCLVQFYSNRDWAGSTTNRKGTTSVVFGIGSGVVSWISRKQDIMTLLSTEEEYVSLWAACCQGVWIKRILTNCGI